MKEFAKKQKVYLGMIVSVIFPFVMFSREIVHSSLWYDEAIEYWVSHSTIGVEPGLRSRISMYERIKDTFQPPLYNWLSYVWLKVFDSEKGYRYLSVLLVTFACVGIYFAMFSISSSMTLACTISIVYASLYSTIYYAQECAEYALVMCLLAWTLAFWVKLLDNFSVTNGILFVVFSCGSVYSQYGAAFPVIGMGIALILKYVCEKKWKHLVRLTEMICGIGVPIGFCLLHFFFFSQIRRATSSAESHKFIIENNLLSDLTNSVKEVLEYVCWFNNKHSRVWTGIFVFLVILSITMLIFSFCKKDKWIWIYVGGFFTYLIYFLAVKTKYYYINYQSGFANRYVLPIVAIELIVWFGLPIFQVLTLINQRKGILIETVSICLLLVFTVFAYRSGYCFVSKNWSKSNAREATAIWIKEEGYEFPTILSVVTDPLAFFYLEKNYADEEKLTDCLLPVQGEFTYVGPGEDLFDTVFGDDCWPEVFFYWGPEIKEPDTLLEEISLNGYNMSVIYQKYDVEIFKMVRQR